MKHPSLTFVAVGAALSSFAAGQRLSQTSISDAQASALVAPLASYIARVEASPSFAKVVAEVAQATARPASALGKGAPSAAEFPALAEALNAVAAKDASVVGGIPADAQQFLAEAAQGEIIVIQSVLAQNGGQATGGAATPAETYSTNAYSMGYSMGAAPGSASSAAASALAAIPSSMVGGNATQPNATGVIAPASSGAAGETHVSTGGAAAAATMGASAVGFVIAFCAGFI